MELPNHFESPPARLMTLMGVIPAEHISEAVSYAMEGVDEHVSQWYGDFGDEAWTPVHIYASMSGVTDEMRLKRAALASSMQLMAAIQTDVHGMPGAINAPGQPGNWSERWDWSGRDRIGNPDLVCMAVDWTIALLVTNARIMGPMSAEDLEAMRDEAVEAILEDDLGSDPSFSDLVQPVAVAMLRLAGIRMPEHDERRLRALSSAFPMHATIDDVSSAWTGHCLVHRAMHREMEDRMLDSAPVMALAQILLSIDLEATDAGADPLARIPMALHAVHDAARTMLMRDVYDTNEAHLFSQSLSDRTAAELSSMLKSREPNMIRLVDALTRRAFVRCIMQRTSGEPFVADEPHLLSNAQRILLVELSRVEQEVELPIGFVDWSIGLAVATILESQEVDVPHDPVWQTISRDLSSGDADRANPDPLTNEGLESMRTGVSVSRGKMTVTGMVVHCVEPDDDAETRACIASIIPVPVDVVPGDIQMTRIARIAPWKCDLDDAIAVTERLREECGVHGAHLVGTIDGRACLIDSHEGHDVQVHVGAARPSWN